MTKSDIDEGYRYGVLLDGATNVRIRYGEDGELEVHPDDMQTARETNEENAKGMILSAVAPGLLNGVFKGIKGLNNVIPQELSKAGPKLVIEEAQFGQKIGKHASDFGLNPGSPQARQWLKELITDIHVNPEEIRKGPWRGIGEVMANGNRAEGTALFYRKGADVVVTDLEGNFVTILKDGAAQNLRFKNAQSIFGTPIE